MQQNIQLFLSEQLESAKQLYAELFVLLELSVNEDPETRQSNQLDLAIANLQARIETHMSVLQQAFARARDSRLLPQVLEQSMQAFQNSLRDGLRIMNDRINQRIVAMTQERDQLRDQLSMVHRKQSGAKGYRQRTAPSFLMESKY